MDQKKLINRVKNKAESEKQTINSLMYFAGDTTVFTISDLVKQKSTLQMAWLEGETLQTKILYEPAGILNISKVLKKSEKELMLIITSDGTVVIISTKDPTAIAPQIAKQQSTH